MPSRGQQLGKLLNSSGDIVETSLPPKIETFSQSVSNTGKIEASALGDDVSTIEQVSDTNSLSASGNTVGDQRIVGNNLYIWNGSGWYRIALINQTPTWDSGGQPSGSYVLDNDSPQDATVITLSASDPDGLPISYSYVTSGSMDSMATISQDSSVFTITPKTVSEVGLGVELTGSITFRASDGVNILPSVSSFTLNFISVIENSRYTTLLATAVDTSVNNNITDSSTNNHTITVTGDAHTGTFSPYRHGGYSYEVTATGNYIAIDSGYLTTNTTWWKSSGFTIEGWVYFTDLTNSGIIDTRVSSASGFLFNMGQVANKISIYSNGSWRGNFDTTFTTGGWYYIVLQVSGTSANLYVNGVLDSTTLTVPDSSTHSYFGQNIHTLGGIQYNPRGVNSLDGFYYDWKFTAGTVYSSNFTPPTESLESDANTALYIKSDTALLRDASSNGSVVTSVGGKTSPFTPYDNFSYSAAENGGSIYFDGANPDSVKISSIASLNGGSWTVEGWYYFEVDPNATSTVFWANNSTGVLGYAFLYTEGPTPSNIAIGKRGDGAYTTATAYDFELYKWYHIATVWNSANNSIRVYINGKQIINGTVNPVINSGNGFTLGSDGYNQKPITGYVSDFRIKTTAEYTSEFTPPTAPQSSSGTILHLKGTDASIIDKSQGSNLKLVGNTTGSTTEVKFAGSKSMYFDGSGDYVTISDLELSGDLTIEGWFYQSTAQSATFRCITGSSTYTSPGSTPVRIYTYGSDVRAYVTSTIYISGSFTANSWHHVALVRSSGTWTLYIDGVSAGTNTTSGAYNFASTTDWYIGASGPDGYPFTGYSQDVRFSNGLARYTANFTPPTAPLKG